ncbi:MAG: M16 family metallopeptidase [Bacteriovoracia bacterium]
MSTILEQTLPNGLDVVIQQTDAPVAAVQAWVDVGSIDETPSEAGFCHFLEHMLFKGTAKRTTSQIAGEIEGAGGEMNAYTSFEHTVYHMTLSDERWKTANAILADMVLGSTFLPKEFNPEKEVILEEIKRSEDSPDRQLYRGGYEHIYARTVYSRPVIGFPKTVKNCTASTLRTFWKKWYKPSLMTLVITGNVDPEQALKEVKKHWCSGSNAKFQKPLRPRRRLIKKIPAVGTAPGSYRFKTFPINSIRWLGVFPACSIQHEDLAALEVANLILGQGETSRLYLKLFREDKLVSSVGSGLWAPQTNGFLSIDVEIPVDKGPGFKHSLENEILRLCQNGISRSELERAKASIESDRIYGSQTMDQLAGRLGYLKSDLGNIHYDLEYLDQIKNLTKEDITHIAKKYLLIDPNDYSALNIREFALFPKEYDPKEFNAVNEKTKSLPKKVAPRSRKKETKQHSNLSFHRLANGIDLVLNARNDIPMVTIYASALGGLRAESRKNAGIGNVLADLWEKGPKDMSPEKFAEYLEDRASRIDSFSGRNSLGLSGTTLTHYLDEVLSMFFETLLNPSLLPNEFEHIQQLTMEDLKTFEDRSERLISKMFCEALFSDHPYSMPMIGYKDSIEALRANDIEKHFKNLISSRKLVLSVSGKFNPDHVLHLTEKLSRKGLELKDIEPITQPILKENIYKEAVKNREQSHLLYGFHGLTIRDSHKYTLRLINTILGGQSGRLFTELRDKQGLCYTVSPSSFEGIEKGFFAVYMGCDPSKREVALKGIKSELEKLCEKKVSEKELKRAKEFFIGRHHMDYQLNSSIASSTSLSALYGNEFDEHTRIREHLNKVTAEDILKVSRMIFQQPSVTAVVV